MQAVQTESEGFDGTRVDAFGWGYRVHERPGACGFGNLMRIVQAVFAISALVAALTLWVLPGSSYGLDVVAMKCAVTVALLIVAAVFWRASREMPDREVHIDFEGEEVRIVRRHGEVTRLVRRYEFAELGTMDVQDQALHLYANDGDRLAVVDLDPTDEARLAA